ncbi:MAG: hypothetical protein IT438_05740 [Phycisphaerales bacterium]|nr:hypothetical protein [Phycisphaerales bacterium]
MNTRSSHRLAGVLAAAALSGFAAAGTDTFTLFSGRIANPSGDQQFVAPVTAPYYHENSLITTDVRAWYAYHKFNSDSILGPDSNASDYAVQVRLALTDRLQLVAYKDGFLDFDGAVVNSEGWNDVAAGLKWQFLRMDDAQLFAALGGGYEFNWGESRALQNDGEARIWASLDKGFDKFHAGLTLNYRITTSDEDRDNGNSDIFSWHARADYRLFDKFSPVVELNGYHIVSDSDTGLTLNGADVLNLGSTDADATITMGLGAEFRIEDNFSIRGAYEFPLADNDDSLFGTRITLSIVYGF